MAKWVKYEPEQIILLICPNRSTTLYCSTPQIRRINTQLSANSSAQEDNRPHAGAWCVDTSSWATQSSGTHVETSILQTQLSWSITPRPLLFCNNLEQNNTLQQSEILGHYSTFHPFYKIQANAMTYGKSIAVRSHFHLLSVTSYAIS